MDEEDRREELEEDLSEESDQAAESLMESLEEAIDSEYHFRKGLLEEIGVTRDGWREEMESRLYWILKERTGQ